MVWHKLLLAVFGLTLSFQPSLASWYPSGLRSGSCVGWGASQGECAPPATGAFGNGGVDLSAGYENSSGGGGTTPRGTGSGGSVSVDGGQQNAADNAPNNMDLFPFATQTYTINCKPGSPCDPTLVVRMSDLVNFQPIPPAQGMQPKGWAVIGLPSNFFATASPYTLSGSLLGFPADVRFTPVGYRWEYGDGTSGGSATGGSSWAAQGLPEFSETNTSHRYRETGNYAVRLTVDYTAEYRFAGLAWRNIAGTLAVPANPLAVVAAQARTVLVDRECTRNPGGPGC